jgi:hypothetical protein
MGQRAGGRALRSTGRRPVNFHPRARLVGAASYAFFVQAKDGVGDVLGLNGPCCPMTDSYTCGVALVSEPVSDELGAGITTLAPTGPPSGDLATDLAPRATFVAVRTVPEPTVLVLFAAGLWIRAVARRRRLRSRDMDMG